MEELFQLTYTQAKLLRFNSYCESVLPRSASVANEPLKHE